MEQVYRTVMAAGQVAVVVVVVEAAVIPVVDDQVRGGSVMWSRGQWSGEPP